MLALVKGEDNDSELFPFASFGFPEMQEMTGVVSFFPHCDITRLLCSRRPLYLCLIGDE
jgi:hypothetical protein